MSHETRRPRVAILTSLIDFSSAYSLCGIILDQAKMFKRAGYDYDLFVLKHFNKEDRKRVEELGLSIRYDLAQVPLHDYQVAEPPKDKHYNAAGTHIPSFDEQVKTLVEGDKTGIGYREAVKDYDVVITHDLMFLSWYVVNNAAIRQVAEELPDVRWIHWAHSGASGRPANVCHPSELRFSAAPNSHYVFLNNRAKQDYANQIGTANERISTVYNPKDIRDVYGFSDEVQELIDRKNLFSQVVFQVYPFSTPRWREKGVRHLLKIFGHWKKMGVSARLLLVNAHCTQDQDAVQVRQMEEYALGCGLEVGVDVIWTSRYCEERIKEEKEKETPAAAEIKRWNDWRYSVPHTVVRDLTLMANTFIFPSVSECCSLIQAEAAVSGKFMVVNRDFLPMLEFTTPQVLHYEFNRNDPDSNGAYYECVAREVWANLQANPMFVNTTRARTITYNRDWIWTHQLEPLLYKAFANAKPREEKPRVEVLPPPATVADTVDPKTEEIVPVEEAPAEESGRVAALEGRVDKMMGLLERLVEKKE